MTFEHSDSKGSSTATESFIKFTVKDIDKTGDVKSKARHTSIPARWTWAGRIYDEPDFHNHYTMEFEMVVEQYGDGVNMLLRPVNHLEVFNLLRKDMSEHLSSKLPKGFALIEGATASLLS